MSTIKVDTIATRTGSGNVTVSNAVLAPSIGGSSDTNTSLSFPGSDIVQLNNGGTARHKFHNLNGNSLFEVESSSTGGSGAGGAMVRFKGSNGTPVNIASIDGSMTDGTSTSESGILSFFTMNSGTNSEKVRIFSNGSMAVPNGISLGNGISAAASNLLDDYEEGTFTPQPYNNTTEITTSSATGFYTKIGNRVFVNGSVTRNDTSTTTSTFQLRNLPFSSSSATGNQYIGGGFWFDTASSTDQVGFAFMNNGENRLYAKTLGLSSAYIAANALEHGRPAYFSAVYFV